MPLRGNLHTHTTFSDGLRSLGQVLQTYETLGYDFLAITDHEDRIGDGYWRALTAVRTDLLLFAGAEIDVDPPGQHVGRVAGDRETLWVLNHPARYRLSVAETRARIASLRQAGIPLDAVEVTDTGRYWPQYDTPHLPLVKVATDDAHRPAHMGRAWVEVEAPRDRDAIIRAIRAGDFGLGFAPR